MGIRYYAYAVDAEQTHAAQADPRAFISSDPFADAWGMEPHVLLGVATLKQRSPKRDLLYLDKAWSDLQQLTGPLGSPVPARPAHRMFEGQVTWLDDGCSWAPFVRALDPEEVAALAPDLAELAADHAQARPGWGGAPRDEDYVMHYLRRATAFVDGLVRDGRGMAYLIG